MPHQNYFRAPARGFTLVELMLTVAIIGMLSGLVIIAIKPSKQLGAARNTERQVEVAGILNAVAEYTNDNGGVLPAAIPAWGANVSCLTASAAAYGICRSNANCSSGVNLTVLTAGGVYLLALPVDPLQADSNPLTGYQIGKDANSRVTVCAPQAEGGASIQVTF
ncbi:MAG: type II secretion system protein [Candidatus Magasanikbacteria bacterium]|nr:type II secretion system protein [Candidatus Magasanikbacteria bacterium]